MTERADLRLLLLQIRNPGDVMAAHEHRCYVGVSGLAPEQIRCADVVGLSFLEEDLDGYDGLLVGGAGEYSWGHRSGDFFEPMKDFLREVIERDMPTFASCFGFHALAETLGGEVVTDPSTMEVGTFELELTDAGAADPIFGHLERRFLVQMGHQDRLSRIPEGVDVLAVGEVIDCQAMRLRGKRIWAAQFHPELTATTNRERYLHYFSVYPGEEPDPKILASFRESPGADELISRFVDSLVE